MGPQPRRAAPLRLATWVGLILGLASFSHSRAALADKRIVLLKFEGPQHRRIERSIRKILRGRHQVISARKYQRAARRLRARAMVPENVALVARKLDADGVLSGEVAAHRGRYLLRLELRAATSGRAVGKLTVQLRGTRLSRKTQALVAERLLYAIDRLGSGDSGDVGEEVAAAEEAGESLDEGAAKDRDGGEMSEDEEMLAPKEDDARAASGPAPEREAAPGREVARAATDREPAVAATSGQQATQEGAFQVQDDEELPPLLLRQPRASDPVSPRARGSGIALAAGLSTLSRQLVFTTRPNMTNPPPGYRSPLVTTAYVTGEFYPMAFTHGSGHRGDFGLGGAVERVLGVITAASGSTNPGADVTTTLMRYRLDLRYRYNFGSKPSYPSVKVHAGYGRTAFAVDRRAAGAVLDLPSTSYAYLDPGMTLRVPLRDRIAAQAEGRFLYVLGAGEIAGASQYGAASVLGFDTSAALEYATDWHLVFCLGGRLMAIRHQFDGTGTMTRARDGDPTTTDIPAAQDRIISGYATVGFGF